MGLQPFRHLGRKIAQQDSANSNQKAEEKPQFRRLLPPAHPAIFILFFIRSFVLVTRLTQGASQGSEVEYAFRRRVVNRSGK